MAVLEDFAVQSERPAPAQPPKARPAASCNPALLGLGAAVFALCGVALMAAAPRHAPPIASAQAPARPTLNTVAASQGLDFELGRTRAVYRTLRVPAKVTNTSGADLAYAEVFCSFYDAAGKLLGHGLANWKSVPPGQTVSGEIVAAGVDLAAVERRDCRGRGARSAGRG